MSNSKKQIDKQNSVLRKISSDILPRKEESLLFLKLLRVSKLQKL